MDRSRLIRDKGEVLTCPFCQYPLTINDNPVFEEQFQIGYDCFRCIVPGVRAVNDKPYSRYSIAVSTELLSIGQFIMVESFVIHIKDDKWYNVYNSLSKEQTNIVMVEPARQEHFLKEEKVVGLVHVSSIAWFPLVDNWNPTDQEGTLDKIKTYLLFL